MLVRLLDAPLGRGCSHCERGAPITYVQPRRGRLIALCLECTMLWFPGKSIEWWEARHAPLRDHVDDKLKAAIEKELAGAATVRFPS